MAIAALAVVLEDWLRLGWAGPYSAIFDVIAILGAGAALGLLTIFVPPLARLFLDRLRADIEARQYARSLFLERELFRTRQRAGVLLLVSRFERAVVILPDTAIRSRVSEDELGRIIAQMTPLLARGETAAALCAGLQALRTLLLDRGFGGPAGDGNEITASLVQEKGA